MELFPPFSALLDRLASTNRAFIALQALTAFDAVATRKRAASRNDAAKFVQDLTELFLIGEANLAGVTDAMRVHRDHNIRFWDGMLWPVMRRAGVRVVLSEDFQDGRELEGVRFINPFLSANAQLVLEITGESEQLALVSRETMS